MGMWLGRHGEGVMGAFNKRPEDVQDTASGLVFIGEIIGGLSPDALIDLYGLIIGCDPAFAEENFDIVDLIDAATAVYKGNSSIRKLIDRFFFPVSSIVDSVEESMTSESPME